MIEVCHRELYSSLPPHSWQQHHARDCIGICIKKMSHFQKWMHNARKVSVPSIIIVMWYSPCCCLSCCYYHTFVIWWLLFYKWIPWWVLCVYFIFGIVLLCRSLQQLFRHSNKMSCDTQTLSCHKCQFASEVYIENSNMYYLWLFYLNMD